MEEKFYRLTSYVRHYAWGMRRHGEVLPYLSELLGEEPGKNIPWAELWIGAHPSLPSSVHLDGGRTIRLDQFLMQAGERGLGDVPAACAGSGLPYLLKVLSCERALSIQSHPDLAAAGRLHEADPAHYPDANHKPEVLLALTPFEALAGFRPVTEVLEELRGLTSVRPWRRVWEAAQTVTMQVICETLLNLPWSLMRTVLTALRGELLELGESLSPSGRLFLRLLEENPCDRGCLFAFLLRFVRLSPGEALYIPANTPHAYLNGTGVECMANSDNVIRAGLTPKFVDIRALLSTLDFSGSAPLQVRGVPGESGGSEISVPASEFRVTIFEGPASVDLSRLRACAGLLLVLDGRYAFSGGAGAEQTGGRGTSWFRPACLTAGTVRPLEAGSRLVLAETGCPVQASCEQE